MYCYRSPLCWQQHHLGGLATACGHPSYSSFFNFTSRAVRMCQCVPLCQPTLTMTTPAQNAKLLLLSGLQLDSKLTPSLASVASMPSHSGATPPPLWASCWLLNVVSHGLPSNWMGLYSK